MLRTAVEAIAHALADMARLDTDLPHEGTFVISENIELAPRSPGERRDEVRLHAAHHQIHPKVRVWLPSG